MFAETPAAWNICLLFSVGIQAAALLIPCVCLVETFLIVPLLSQTCVCAESSTELFTAQRSHSSFCEISEVFFVQGSQLFHASQQQTDLFSLPHCFKNCVPRYNVEHRSEVVFPSILQSGQNNCRRGAEIDCSDPKSPEALHHQRVSSIIYLSICTEDVFYMCSPIWSPHATLCDTDGHDWWHIVLDVGTLYDTHWLNQRLICALIRRRLSMVARLWQLWPSLSPTQTVTQRPQILRLRQKIRTTSLLFTWAAKKSYSSFKVKVPVTAIYQRM